jgi:hypothetical protein
MQHCRLVLQFALPALLCVGAAVPALGQQPAAAPPKPFAGAKVRLLKALATTAHLQSCAFRAHWGPVIDKPEQGNQPALMMRLIGQSVSDGAVTGTWCDPVLLVDFGEQGKVVQVGRRRIAEPPRGSWVERTDRLGDGSPLGFLPDPQFLLEGLQRMDLEVIHDDVGNLQDRPVEIVTVTLAKEQVATLSGSSLWPRQSALFVARAVGPHGRTPDATVDVACFLDPATGFVHAIKLRGYEKSPFRVMAGGGGGGIAIQVASGNESSDDEKDRDAAAKKGGSELKIADGLPERDKENRIVFDYVLEFSDHGRVPAPALDDNARALLGIK